MDIHSLIECKPTPSHWAVESVWRLPDMMEVRGFLESCAYQGFTSFYVGTSDSAIINTVVAARLRSLFRSGEPFWINTSEVIIPSIILRDKAPVLCKLPIVWSPATMQ